MSNLPMEDTLKKKTSLLATAIASSKYLASNDSKVRKHGMSCLKKWLSRVSATSGTTSDATKEDYNRIWTGLFYYFWMSDKPLVQEAAAERISSLIHYLNTLMSYGMFIRGFFITLSKNFEIISSYRTEKFLMLVRRFLRQMISRLQIVDWNEEYVDVFATEIFEAQQVLPFSLSSHLNEIFNEEVAKVSKGNLTTKTLIGLYKGYVECIMKLKPNMQVIIDVQENVFGSLLKQLKFYIQQLPYMDEETNENNKTVDSEESECEKDDVSNGENALDPRPGSVDVILPYIIFDETQYAAFLKECRDKGPINRKSKNILNHLIRMMEGVTSFRESVMVNKSTEIEENVESDAERIEKRKSTKEIKKATKRRKIEKSDEQIQKELDSMGDIIRIKHGKKSVLGIKKPIKNPATNKISKRMLKAANKNRKNRNASVNADGSMKKRKSVRFSL